MACAVLAPGGPGVARLQAIEVRGRDTRPGVRVHAKAMEHALRQCALALRVGERLALSAADRAVLYYVSLLSWVGCHIDAYEQAKWFGDDLALKAGFRLADPVGVRSAAQMVRQIGAGRQGADRAAAAVRFLAGGMRDATMMLRNHAYAADQLARDLGLSRDVRDAVLQAFERWDGKGAPGGAKGEKVTLTARIVNLADVLQVFHRAGGIQAAVEVARQRSGTQFDPLLVELVASQAPLLFADLDQAATWTAIIDAEPAPGPPLTSAQLDASLQVIGDFTDLKSPYTLGHARAVAGSQPRPRRRCPGRRAMSPTCAGRRCSTISGGWVSPTRSGTSPAR
jgi:hypothetical protein